ncbi:hypothetical protein I7I50_09810 [Histoplasma capsulatum G186AR]|uniref:Uncharacterized protein n=1 Tax=Ajellomyces capsulatus TaxID=5037 RepID=A0A8H7Z373_AJECA|nr:hypothetical protein I7I52_10874 [Histoplasma capsulatum]QSS68743.1 hypothetical protein I7I50_09810 [Histoplasma capsulatum G186AR]
MDFIFYYLFLTGGISLISTMKKCRCGLVCVNLFCGLTGQFHCSLHIFWRFVWLAFAGKAGRFEGHEIYVNSFL